MMMNSIGMIKIPNNVAVVIPATTVIPIEVRAPEPAPLDTANGKDIAQHYVNEINRFNSEYTENYES